MFVNAVEKVGGYTRPIFTIARRYDSIDVLPGASNLFFINDEGWALTTRATARLIIKSGKIEENYSKFRADRKARENDENFQDELRLLETKYGMGGKSFAQLKVNFFDCVDNLTGFECKLSKNHELAAIHMMGYNNLTYVGHAVFAEDARRAMPGKYLCRLGYPFPEFRNYSYDPEKDDIVWTDAGHRFTSRFPADGMLTRLMADGRGKVFGIEMSGTFVPGLNGAPVFDENAIVYGMQFAAGNGGLTQCLHASLIKEFLKAEHIPFFVGDADGGEKLIY